MTAQWPRAADLEVEERRRRRRSNFFVSPEEELRIVALREAGTPLTAIAEQVGRGLSTVTKVVKEVGVLAHSQRLRPQEEHAICERVRAGATATAVAKEFRRDLGTVRRTLRDGGVAWRGTHLSQAEEDRIIAMAGPGVTFDQLAERSGRGRSTVLNIFRRRGLTTTAAREGPRGGGRHARVDREAALELVRMGLSTTAVAERLSCSREAIQRIAGRGGAGLLSPRAPITARERKEMVARFRVGATAHAIGAALDRCPVAVLQHLRAAGVTDEEIARRKSEAMSAAVREAWRRKREAQREA